MNNIGELISIAVAFLWTVTAMASEIATKRMGVFVTNVWRMGLALLMSSFVLFMFSGHVVPYYADAEVWGWLLLSGVVGYFFGDWCLFNCYLWIGSRLGQLFMTMAPMAAALAAWVTLGQNLTWRSFLAMMVTLSGIAISVLGRGEGHRLSLKLPLRGVLFGIGAGLGQGFGLVISKIGLDKYEACVPCCDVQPSVSSILPFGANLIRCIAGLVCFSLWLMVRGEGLAFRNSRHDYRGMGMLLIAVFFGPFLGVALSLMAVQYTAAGIASTLMATTPIVILLPSHLIFHEKISLRTICGAMISVLGVSLFFLL